MSLEPLHAAPALQSIGLARSRSGKSGKSGKRGSVCLPGAGGEGRQLCAGAQAWGNSAKIELCSSTFWCPATVSP